MDNSKEIMAIRHIIQTFISERKQTKLDALKPDDFDERAKIESKYLPELWLDSAARRVNQIQLATHTLKPIHPDARGTNLFVPHYQLNASSGLVGTHCVNPLFFTKDVVGNAAALDVFKLLDLKYNDVDLLTLLLEPNHGLELAFSEDIELAKKWITAFVGITQGDTRPISDALAKQIYFPLADGGYHLLAPLFPTTLVHEVSRQIKEDRFSDSAKAARAAKKKGEFFPMGYREYPDLVVRNFGGSKPQNISLLNSQRMGESFLLSSCPPAWQHQGMKPPLHINSVFGDYLESRPKIRALTKMLREFLVKVIRSNNVSIRQKRMSFVEQIIDEVLAFSAKFYDLPAGWSVDSQLNEAECLWLDPNRAMLSAAFADEYENGEWREEIASRFAKWLNAIIATDKTPMGDVEEAEWRSDFNTELNHFSLAL